MIAVRPTLWIAFAALWSLVLQGCGTLPSCAFGKCAYPPSPAWAPQMSERIYPAHYADTYEAVKQHLEHRGYPLARADDDILETEPYAERRFARLLGLRYSWRVQVRKLNTLNTAVLPVLFLHEDGKPPRELTPGLWAEPYRFFYQDVERSLVRMMASTSE